MAKIQTRRTVSLNRTVYDTALAHAHRSNQTLAELVTDALRRAGVAIPETEHTPVAVVAHAQERRRRIGEVKARLDASIAKRPGLIRQMLGDQIADMCGEP